MLQMGIGGGGVRKWGGKPEESLVGEIVLLVQNVFESFEKNVLHEFKGTALHTTYWNVFWVLGRSVWNVSFSFLTQLPRLPIYVLVS